MTKEEISKKIDYFNQCVINVSDDETEKLLREFMKVANEIIDLYNKEKNKNIKLKEDREFLYGVIDEINEKHNKLINNILQLYNNKYTEYELTIALRKLLEEIDND